MAMARPVPPPPTDRKEPRQETSAAAIEVPSTIFDKTTSYIYLRGKLLGKGGFARCYEVTDSKTNAVVACKVVNKQLLLKPHQREKMGQEIKIHRELSHEFIVKFISFFEDDANVYITLELCSKKSLMELQKRRRVVTEPEAKYFLRQICLAIQYLHDDKHIIHRDLKLGNIFISEEMTLKVGDFGLATQIEFDGERKKTLCGTPNYIAPEVLAKKGHSYEVDIWSVGCILYTLLIGKPPFETATLRDTYHKIRRGDYYFPTTTKISQHAKTLLYKLLQVNPALRPAAKEILRSDFLIQGYMPPTLPSSVLTMAPRFDHRPRTATQTTARRETTGTSRSSKPLTEIQLPATSSAAQLPRPGSQRLRAPGPSTAAMNVDSARGVTDDEPVAFAGELTITDIVEHMKTLRDQMKRLIDLNPPRSVDDDESEDPSQAPLVWICKWVDYSDKYGFGYHLSDDSIGVSFNDQTKIVLLSDHKSIHYIEKNGTEQYHSMENYPPGMLEKKVKLLKYFQKYMNDNLMKATGGRSPPDTDCIARVPNMWTWFRTSRAVVMVLSNGTLQINNFRDHSKMIICPLLGALTTLSSTKNMQTYRLDKMENGLSQDMYERLKYALEKIEVIIGNRFTKAVTPRFISSPTGRNNK